MLSHLILSLLLSSAQAQSSSPDSTVERVVAEIRSHERAIPAQFGFTFEINANGGAYPLGVVSVVSGLPAEEAGLKPGDGLVSVDGLPLRSKRMLEQWLLACPDETATSWRIARKNGHSTEHLDVTMRSTVRPELDLGLALKADGLRVVVAYVVANSQAAAAGLKQGERVVAVDGQAVKSLTHCQQLLKERHQDASVLFRIETLSGQHEMLVLRTNKQSRPPPSWSGCENWPR